MEHIVSKNLVAEQFFMFETYLNHIKSIYNEASFLALIERVEVKIPNRVSKWNITDLSKLIFGKPVSTWISNYQENGTTCMKQPGCIQNDERPPCLPTEKRWNLESMQSYLINNKETAKTVKSEKTNEYPGISFFNFLRSLHTIHQV